MGEQKRVKALIPASGGVWFQTNFRINPATQYQRATQEYTPPVITTYPEIVQLVLNIPGVERVVLSFYTLSVFATKAVTIQEVETQVLAAFKDVYPDAVTYGINDEIQPQQSPSGLVGRLFSIFKKPVADA